MAHDHSKIRRTVVDCCEALLVAAQPPLQRTRETPEGFVLASVLNALVWKHSEASGVTGGKYHGCNWWSLRATKSWTDHRAGTAEKPRLIFEHVVLRAEIIRRLFGATARADIMQALENVVTCVVLKCEADALADWDSANKAWHQKAQGEAAEHWWERYKGCNIVRVSKLSDVTLPPVDMNDAAEVASVI
jgi:hypothetical protein